ncbi:tetratricopeptide repeat protein [Fluviispira vulneris]|uniref:tetratricopeptide repeat protein n=1 Tax=Fluviispira vulneris TaxID=2763012 RepID=UPI00164883FA|nr:tetratricopeptide repeat protein [Fluviispira vulneris]
MNIIILLFLIIISIFPKYIYADENIFIPKIPEKSETVDPKKYLNIEQMEHEKLIFRNIFDLHFKNWKEEFNREIEYEDFKSASNEKMVIEENNRVKEEKFNKVIEFLSQRIEINHNKIIQAEASFKLALYSYFAKKMDANKAIEVLQKGLHKFPIDPENMRLFIRMSLFTADLLLANERYDEAQKYYEAIVLQKVNANVFREELVRSYVGLGDTYYARFQFKKAGNSYLHAQDVAKAGWLLDEDRLAFLLAEIKIRLLWATFRSADYVQASEYAYQLARDKVRYEKYFKDNILNDIIRVGAISLYERKDIEFYKKISSDLFAGDFAKKMVLKSFYYFSAAGYANQVERYANAVIDKFYSSRELVGFVKSYLFALKKINNTNKYFEISYYGTAYISKDSIWKSRFVLSQEEEEARRELISELSEDSAKYFYNLGLQNHSRIEFLKSADIYSARLNENFRSDSKGILLQSYAQSLYQAQEYDLAIKASEESLKYPLEDYLKKVSWFQLINISRAKSENSVETKSKEYLMYEKFVDGFVAYFPLDPESRLALFESAKRAEFLGDLLNAKDRYERILSSPPLENQEQSNNEKNKVSLALALLLKKMGVENKDIMDSAGNLENYIKDYTVTKMAEDVVRMTNQTIALEYAKKLKGDGKIRDAAKFLEMWSRNYSQNPEMPLVLLQSISEFAQLQDWEHILNITLNFQNIILDRSNLSALLFWQAKAQDMLLQFKTAALTYEKVFDTVKNNKKYDINLIRSSLTRSSELFSYLNSIDEQARVSHKLYSVILKFEKDQLKIAQYEIDFAELLFLNSQYAQSRDILYSAIKRKKMSKKINNKILVGLLKANLYINKKSRKYEDDILKFIENNSVLKDKNKDDIDFYLLTSLLVEVNNFDEENFKNEEIMFKNDFSLNRLMNIENIKNFIGKRFKIISKSKDLVKEANNTEILYAKLLTKLADLYSQFYYNKKANDNYLLKANQFNLSARQHFYNALMSDQLSSDQKLLISIELSKFGKRDFAIPPEINIEDFSSDSALYNSISENLNSFNFLVKDEEKK